MSLLSLSNLTRKRGLTSVLRDVSLDLEPAMIGGILGGRGAGKKVLLQLIVGNETADQGTITFDGQDITRRSAKDRRSLGLASPLLEPGGGAKLKATLFGEPPVDKRLAAAAAASRRDPRTRAELIEQVLLQLDLHPVQKQRLRDLSAGQRLRVELAELLVTQPQLVVLDEPFKALDNHTRAGFLQLLRDLALNYRLAFLLSDRSGHSREVCTRLFHLEKGVLSGVEDIDPSAPPPAGVTASGSRTAEVFLSYSRQDQPVALQIVEFLQTNGKNVWFDQSSIPAASHWDHEIEQALQGATSLVMVLSPNSAASKNVLDEVSYALDRGIPVFPLLVEECEAPLRLRRIQHLDLRSNFQAGLADLLERLPQKSGSNA